jgi:2-(1,2-epoxy-1,2-dihydrophenyl)acetyl-CoA isomerase
MAYEHILVEKRDSGVGVITFNRPEKMNALNRRMADELVVALNDWREDAEIRAVVLTGAGRGFCAGADLSGEGGIGAFNATDSNALPDIAQRPRWPLGNWVRYLNEFPRPIIAAVNGACVGAGLGLAAACDMRVAAASARFSAIFVKRGLSLDFGTSFFLPRLVGQGRALEIACTGRMVGAEEAERIGLANRVVPDEQVVDEAVKLAQDIAEAGPIAVEFSKKAVLASLGNDLEGQLFFESYAQEVCRYSEDAKEGIQAFLEKRTPSFKGL